MQLMGLRSTVPQPQTSVRRKDHPIYPYLLQNVVVDRVNQVWAADITYTPMPRGYLYLVAVIDWYSRKVLSWRLSHTLEADFCVEALREALATYGKPEIFNTDQGVQFTSSNFVDTLKDADIRISMDGKGRWLDNVFVERLWRSLKYEEVYLHAYATVSTARAGIARYLQYFNQRRSHSSLDDQTPDEVYYAEIEFAKVA
jgi:putative transposase